MVFILPVFVLFITQQCVAEVTLPEPHIVMLGATGVGKSSLGNVLVGGPPECKEIEDPSEMVTQPLNCWFGVCHSATSCTKGTQYATGLFVGNGDSFTVIDTPGFGDSSGDDNILITQMVDSLKNQIKTANIFVLTMNGQSERFDTLIQQMLREVEALFGTTFWDHVIIEATHWSWDMDDVEDREEDAEAKWCASMNKEIQNHFLHVSQNFTCVFIDSWAKKGNHVNDPDEQAAFERETAILWQLTEGFGPFEFKTLEDILADLFECQEERDCLDGIIENELADLKKFTNEQTEALWIHVNTDDNLLEEHSGRLNAIEAKDTIQDSRLDSIEKKDTTQDSRLDSIETKDTTQDSRLDSIETKDLTQDSRLDSIETKDTTQDSRLDNMLPIGSIIAWAGKTKSKTELPQGWQNCDGTKILRGPMKDLLAPNLNNENRFLRGGSTDEDQAGGEDWTTQEAQIQTHTHVLHDPGHHHTYWHGKKTGDSGGGAADKASDDDDALSTTTEHTGISMKLNAKDIDCQPDSLTCAGNETRPKSMFVQYIIKICDQTC